MLQHLQRTPPSPLRDALRQLALPTADVREREVIAAAERELRAVSSDGGDQAAFLLAESDAWARSGTPSRRFRAVVRAALLAGDDGDLGARLAASYFPLHDSLRRHHLLSHAHAVHLLSHARLIGVLAREERLSGAMIAGVLQARDQRTPLSWKLVERVLQALGLDQCLTPEMVAELIAADSEAEGQMLADASFTELASFLGEAGRAVKFPYDLEHEIGALLPLGPNGSPVWPRSGAHLPMLYFACAQIEFWDHRASAVYEFSARGNASEVIGAWFREAGVYQARESPFLNTAKSAGLIDREWAWTKKSAHEASAHALANVINGLDQLARSPRRHIAMLLRTWLLRVARVKSGSAIELPHALDDAQARRLATAVATAPTRTRGILEQRLVDAICSATHTGALARGVGDSVNASNVSRLKFGDAEFQVPAGRAGPRLVAYEAHSGDLRQQYVDAHDATLDVVAERRLKQWDETASTARRWELDVVHVGFSTAGVRLPAEREIAGERASLRVRYTARSFTELLADVPAGRLCSAVNEHMLRHLSRAHVPDAVLEALLERIEPGLDDEREATAA